MDFSSLIAANPDDFTKSLAVAAGCVILSLAGFLLMGADKARSKRQAARIPERVLLGLAILGGSPGIFAGMVFFRHKTRHARFRYGVPLILLLQVILVVWLLIIRPTGP
jgi:uncharacterized protein